MKEILLKHKELPVLLILALFLVIFLNLIFGTPGVIRVSFAVLFALVLVFLLFASTIRWRFLSYFFFLWLLLEGIFRKWILPDNLATPAFFIKHIILAGPYFYLFTKGFKITKRDYPFFGLLLAYSVWGLFEAFNLRVTSDIRVQILGLITHFFFVPLIFLVPAVLDTYEKILKAFKLIMYLSIPIFVLGTIQYYSPGSSWLNTYAPSQIAGDMAIATVGEYVRITGVFSYISTYTTYLGMSLMVILYLLIVERTNKYETLLLFIAISLGVTNLLMTGSRAAVAVFIIQALPFLLFAFRGRIKVRKKILIRLALVTPALLFVLIYTDTGKNALSSFIERTQNVSSDVGWRLKEMYTPFKYFPEAGLIGYGIGTAYQGSMALVQDWGDMPRNFEEEWERIVLELGLVGFIIVMLLRTYVFYYSWRVFRRIKSYNLKLIALIILIRQLFVFMSTNIVFNYFENIIYWSLIGLLVALARLDRNHATKGSSMPTV